MASAVVVNHIWIDDWLLEQPGTDAAAIITPTSARQSITRETSEVPSRKGSASMPSSLTLRVHVACHCVPIHVRMATTRHDVLRRQGHQRVLQRIGTGRWKGVDEE